MFVCLYASKATILSSIIIIIVFFFLQLLVLCFLSLVTKEKNRGEGIV